MIVIFQGAWTPDCTTQSFESVRQWHSGRIILSTWKDQNLPQINEELLLLEDPQTGPVQNFRRQVVGLKAALRDIPDDEIVLKLRSDMICPKNPLKFFSLEKCNDMFSYKVGISKIMTRDPEQFPWYISDWIWLGLAKDIKKIVSINPDECTIIDQSTEATWAKSLNIKYSSILDPKNFIQSNYKVLNISSDMNMSCGHYPNQPEDHPFYIKL